MGAEKYFCLRCRVYPSFAAAQISRHRYTYNL